MKTKSLCAFVRLNLIFLGIGLVVKIALGGDGYPNNVSDSEDELLAGSSGGSALPTWSVSEPYMNLWISGQPISYNCSWNSTMGFGIAYKQRNTRSSTNIFGLGPRWESSWLSYVQYEVNGTNVIVDTTFVALGGERSYVPDGVTKEFKSSSTMTKLTDGNGNLTGFRINNPDGSQDVYSYLLNLSTNVNYAVLTQEIDPSGRTNRFNYDTSNNIVRLRTIVDWDNRTNTILYNSTFTAQIGEVDNPYGAKATFGYTTNGLLASVTNAVGLSSSFVYDSQGLVTNLVTPYGTTKFKTTTNSFAPYNLGGTNQVNRSVEITEADGLTKELFLYRDQSTKLNPTSNVDLIPNSYPTNQVPNTSPLTNTFDNASMDGRDSFHWDRKQYSGLSANYLQTGDFNNLTTNDYLLATMTHWLRGYTNAAVLKATISLRREGSPDGSLEGQKSWFDYAGKVSQTNGYWGTLGTNSQPLFLARVLPDGSSSFNYFARNQWEKSTSQIGTYSSGSGVATRTNTYTYATNGIDLVQLAGPSGELLSSNSYNGFHQVVTNINAVNDVTKFTYDSATHQLTSTALPTGLILSNYYFGSGTYQGWLSQTVDYDGNATNAVRTNSFTYTNGMVFTQTNPRGLSTTNAWDNLLRLTTMADPSGTSSNSYSNLDLTQKIDPLSHTNQFVYDSMRRMCQSIDARRGTNGFSYSDPSGLTIETNACQEKTSFAYNWAKNVISTTFPDSNSVHYYYNLVGQATNVVDSVGNSVTNYYNNQGLLVASSNVFGQVYRATFDVRDRATNVVTAEGVSIVTTYDNMNRMLTKTYPDGGAESFGYSARGVIAYTNQLGKVTTYGYDSSRRLIAVTNSNNEVVRYTYSPADDVLTMVDGKNQTNRWSYDQFGRATNQVDAAGNTVLTYQYDNEGKLTNRWSAAKGNTSYAYDDNGNLTNVTYPVSPALSFVYDAENRTTNMVDGVGTTRFSYTPFGDLQSEDGPWANDTISYSYNNNRLRSSLTLAQPNASPWVQVYTYDSANRLQAVSSTAGTFTYTFKGSGNLVTNLALPNGAAITNAFDNAARLTGTYLRNSGGTILNSHTYGYNVGNQRRTVTNFAGSYLNYTYDGIGQLKTAAGKESGGSSRLHEQFGYAYDAAGNLNYRTNNALVQTFTVNNLNELSSVTRSGTLTVAGTTTSTATNVTVNSLAATLYGDKTFSKDGFSLVDGNNTFTATAQDTYGRKDTNSVTVNLPAANSYIYDINGNLTSDGTRGFDYDDENQLIRVTVTNKWKSEFTYDGKFRRRIRKEYSWINSSWVVTNEVHYIYDGNVVIQEREVNNVPLVSYTRGQDPSGAFEGAGGIGGLLARTDHSTITPTHAYYHADGNGNITALANDKQIVVARYEYDPFGNILSKAGSSADANLYRFSSKESHLNSGLYYYGRRFFDPNLQRWLNVDPLTASTANAHMLRNSFNNNDPINEVDPWGLAAFFNVTARRVPNSGGPRLPPFIVVTIDAYVPIYWCNCSEYSDDVRRSILKWTKFIWDSATTILNTPGGNTLIERLRVHISYATGSLPTLQDPSFWNFVFDESGSFWPRQLNAPSPSSGSFNSILGETWAWYGDIYSGLPAPGFPNNTVWLNNAVIRSSTVNVFRAFAHEFGHLLNEGDHYKAAPGLRVWSNNIMGLPLPSGSSLRVDDRNLSEIIANNNLSPRIEAAINSLPLYSP